jgi:hypothetical protein
VVQAGAPARQRAGVGAGRAERLDEEQARARALGAEVDLARALGRELVDRTARQVGRALERVAKGALEVRNDERDVVEDERRARVARAQSQFFRRMTVTRASVITSARTQNIW